MADDECKQEECPPGAPVWMCTFADLMSLLLCFFVLLLSFSVMDAQKYKMVQGSMTDAFGVQKQTHLVDNPSGQNIVAPTFLSTPMVVKVQHEINEVIAEEVDKGLIDIELSQDGLLLRMKDSIAFQFGKAEIRPDFKVILDKIGKIVAKADASITVNGHTDNVPLKKAGKYSSNWSLSTARAVSVVEYWVTKFDIPAYRMAAAGYADGKPVASNDTAEGRAENRRVEFKIKLNQQATTFQGIKELLEPLN